MNAHDPFPEQALSGARLRAPTAQDARRLADGCAAMDPYRRLGYSSATLERYLCRVDPTLYRLVIDVDGEAAGVMALRFPWLRGPFLEMLAILPAAQGRGLGRQALDWAIHRSAAVAANLWTTVSDFNDGALRFYRRLGFVEVGPLADLVTEGAGEILMRRRIDKSEPVPRDVADEGHP